MWTLSGKKLHVSDKDGQDITFHLFSNDLASSSIFAANPVVWAWEHVVETNQIPRTTIRLDTLLNNTHPGIKFDSVSIDIQGGELAALRGLGTRLNDVQAILSEVSLFPYYTGAPLFRRVWLVERLKGSCASFCIGALRCQSCSLSGKKGPT